MNKLPAGKRYLGIYESASLSQGRLKKYPMILVETIRRGRVIEAIYGVLCFAIRKPGRVEGDLRIETGQLLPYLQYGETTTIKDLQGEIFSTRVASIHEGEDTIIAGEYAFPGARIYVKKGKLERYYEPYASYPGVLHIHSLTKIADDLFFVSTGDTSKFLDVLRINEVECRIVKRCQSFLGGYTSGLRISDRTYFGSDFSFRPNFILCLETREKHFLPRLSWLNIVISIREFEADKLMIFTRKLYSASGTVLVFERSTKKFRFEGQILEKCPGKWELLPGDRGSMLA